MGSFLSCYHNYNNGRFGFVFFLAAISTIGGGIYLRFDHKHFNNNFFSCYFLFTALELL